MITATVPIADIRLDAGTQVRATVDPTLVDDYAHQMAGGAVFPPVVVFVLADGTRCLTDGFHRYHAAVRLGEQTLRAELHTGSLEDALWYALGANRTNGQRLSEADKSHAVHLALAQWPAKMLREIAEQVGCSTSLASKVAREGAATNTGVLRGRRLVVQTQRAAVRAMVQAGHSTKVIRQTLHAHSTTVASVKRELGLIHGDLARGKVQARRATLRELATAGHTSAQIAALLGINENACRERLRLAGITAPGDVVTRNLHRHDSNRIMARIVADAEDLAEGAQLIDFGALNHEHVADWIATLRHARTTIGRFITRLLNTAATQQEQGYGDQAADTQAVESSSGSDRADARAAGARGSA